jgi:replicative DNA helicase
MQTYRSKAKNETARGERAECIGKPKNQSNRNNSLDESQPINPSNLSAERCVLGALIEDDSLVPAVIDTGLQVQDFFLSDHRRVFQVIEMLQVCKVPVDYVSVAEQLGNSQDDYVLIASLVHGVVLHEDHVLHHAAIIRRKARLRALLVIGEWISSAVTESADPDALIAQIRNMLDFCSEGQIRA